MVEKLTSVAVAGSECRQRGSPGPYATLSPRAAISLPKQAKHSQAICWVTVLETAYLRGLAMTGEGEVPCHVRAT